MSRLFAPSVIQVKRPFRDALYASGLTTRAAARRVCSGINSPDPQGPRHSAGNVTLEAQDVGEPAVEAFAHSWV